MRNIDSKVLSWLLAPAIWIVPLAVSADTPAPSSSVLGNGGEVYSAIAGTYGELFAEGEELDGETPVLVLSVGAGEEPVLGMVPETADAAVERDPVLHYDRRASRVILLWKSDVEAGTRIRFANFDGTEWSEVDTLLDGDLPLDFASDPRMATTRDAFDVELEDGETHGASRLVHHLVWQTEGEIPRTLYSPITFVDGIHNGSSHIFDLSETLLLAVPPPAEGETPEVTLPAGLERALTLEPGAGGRSLRVTFASSPSGLVGTVDIGVLPLALEQLGIMVRQQIDALADLYDPEDMVSFSDGFRASVVIIGSILGVNPATVEYAAAGAGEWILDNGGGYTFSDFVAFGDDLGEHTLDLASSVHATVAADPGNPDQPIVRIDLSELLADVAAATAPRIFELRVRSARPFPESGDAAATLYSSRDGKDLLVSWVGTEEGEEQELLFWIESRNAVDGGDWSEVRSLALADDMPEERGRALLRRHIR